LEDNSERDINIYIFKMRKKYKLYYIYI